MREGPLLNELLAWKNDSDRVERVLWIDEGNIIAYCIDISSDKGFPLKVRITDIRDNLNRGELEILNDDPFGKIAQDADLSESELKIRNIRWNVVQYVLSSISEPNIYIGKMRGPIIVEASEKYRISIPTVYKYLRVYWQRGMNPNALIPDYSNSGGRGKEKEAGEKKRGRPRKYASTVGMGINVDETTKRTFLIAFEKYYKTRKGNSLTFAYEEMLKDFFVEDVYFDNGERKVILLGEDERPSFDQFRYWVEKQTEKDFVQTEIARKGEKNFDLKGRAMLSRSDVKLIGPGSLYQIDSTVGDVYLVSRFNREWIIGRPVIYAILDAFTRMVAGIYVGLEGPSWLGAANALANCAMDKVEFCKQYDIEIQPDEWTIKGLPEAIISDRGELIGKPVETLINNLHVRFITTPPYRADLKGIIEQYFRTTNIKVKPLLPGFVDVDFKERGGRDYRLDAKLDLFQFTQIMIRCALKHNASLMKYYERGEMMIDDDIPAIPQLLWRWGMVNRSGSLRYFPEDIVKLNLMPAGNATVTEKGMVFQGMRYSSEKAIRQAWFEKARARGTWSENISYDPRNMDYIYIRESGGRGYEKFYLLDSEGKYKGKSFDEIVYLREYEKLTIQRSVQNELKKKVDLNISISAIIDQAESMAPDKNGLENKSARIRGIKPKRKIELIAEQEQTAFVLPKFPGEKRPTTTNELDNTVQLKNDTEYGEPSDIELFKRKQREKLHGGMDTHEY